MKVSNNVNVPYFSNNNGDIDNKANEAATFSVIENNGVKKESRASGKNENSSNEHLRKISLEEFKKMESMGVDKISAIQNWQYGQFLMSEEYAHYNKEKSIQNGKERETERIIKVGNESIIYKKNSTNMSNNLWPHYVAGDMKATLDNILSAFGREKVEVMDYENKESPTNAEVFKMITGKDYYRHIMSDGKLG